MPLEDEFTPFQRLCISAGELMVHVGLMSSVSQHWPQEVQDNWEERIEDLILKLDDQVTEIQMFGEALD